MHIILWFLAGIMAWAAIGALCWLFCMMVLWSEPFSLDNINDADREALKLLTLAGPISWFIIFLLIIEDIRKARKFTLHLPRYKTKGQKFLEKLES